MQSIDFGYPWWLSYGHLAVLGAAAVLLAVITALRGALWIRIGLGLVALWSLAAFVLIHFATMVIFVPYDYDNRLVLPMYLPIVVFSGYALSELAIRAVERARRAGPARAAILGRPGS